MPRFDLVESLVGVLLAIFLVMGATGIVSAHAPRPNVDVTITW